MIGTNSHSRARTMIAAISALLASGASYLTLPEHLKNYVSRGKGMGKTSYAKKTKKHAHNWESNANGDRAMARRQRQIASGMLQAEHGLMLG